MCKGVNILTQRNVSPQFVKYLVLLAFTFLNPQLSYNFTNLLYPELLSFVSKKNRVDPKNSFSKRENNSLEIFFPR